MQRSWRSTISLHLPRGETGGVFDRNVVRTRYISGERREGAEGAPPKWERDDYSRENALSKKSPTKRKRT